MKMYVEESQNVQGELKRNKTNIDVVEWQMEGIAFLSVLFFTSLASQ
jgi:hypothetical protein